MAKGIISVVLINLCIWASGCGSFLFETPYLNIVDQFYTTRGASEARLGSYGVVDTLGLDSFERIGYKPELVQGLVYRRTWVKSIIHQNFRLEADAKTRFKNLQFVRTAEVKAHVDVNEAGQRTVVLEVFDVNKAELAVRLDRDTALKNELRHSSRYRIITAAAYVVDYNDAQDRQFRANGTVTNPVGIDVNLGLTFEQEQQQIIGKGTVYAYQMSHIEWSEDLRSILALKTDRAVFADELTVGYSIHGEKKVADGDRCDVDKSEKCRECWKCLEKLENLKRAGRKKKGL